MYKKTFIGVTIPREEYDPDHYDGVPVGLLSAYWQSSWRPCELNKTFVLEFLASGFERFINGVESRIFVIAKGFDREGVADIVILFMCCRAISLHSIRTAVGAMPCGHTRLCAWLCARPLRGLRAYAG